MELVEASIKPLREEVEKLRLELERRELEKEKEFRDTIERLSRQSLKRPLFILFKSFFEVSPQSLQPIEYPESAGPLQGFPSRQYTPHPRPPSPRLMLL